MLHPEQYPDLAIPFTETFVLFLLYFYFFNFFFPERLNTIYKEVSVLFGSTCQH